MWFLVALVGILFLATIFLAPKPNIENARASSLDDIKFPQAKEGTPIPWILGKVRQKGPNTVWYGDFKARPIKKKVKTGMFSSKKVITGYKYYLGFDLVLGLGPSVTLHRIWCDKDEVWSGTASADENTVSINKPELWGGNSDGNAGGGLVATIKYYCGTFSQPVNAYMASKVPGGVYNRLTGQCHAVFEHAYIGNSPQLRPFSFELSRYPNGLGLLGNTHIIGEDANPAAGIYDLMTSKWGGLGVDTNDIDTDTFLAVGQTLFDESNGISLVVSRSNSGKQLIEEMLRQIDGIMYQDPTTGKIKLELIREDYDILDLPILDESNIVAIRNFARTSWEDTLNQVRVTYTNRANGYESGGAMQQDMANINAQGRVRSSNFSFPGCTVGLLANKLCARELARMSIPLFKGTIEINRTVTGIRPGRPFILSWPAYGIEQVVMRAQRFNLGELLDGKCVIEALQDIYAVSQTLFAEPPGTGWEPINSDPVVPAAGVLVEVPYWLMKQQQEVSSTPTATSRGWVLGMARPASDNQLNWIYDVTQSGETIEAEDVVDWTNTAVLDAAITAISGQATGKIAEITISGVLPDATFLTANTAGAIASTGAGMFYLNGELMAYEGVTAMGGGVYKLTNVWRGLLDTRPLAHAANSILFFVSIDGLVESELSATTAISGNFYSRTTKGASAALAVNVTPNRRFERPAPPGNVQVNSVARSETQTVIAGNNLSVSWVGRNRTDTTIRTQVEGNVAPEASTTYNLRWYLNNTLKNTYSNVTSPYVVPTNVADVGDVRIEVDSVMGGLASFNPAVYYVSLLSGVAPPGPQRYWQVRSTDTHISGEYMACVELELRETVDGADSTAPGTSITASANAGGAYVPASAIDNNTGTFWTTGAAAQVGGSHWLRLDYGVGVTKDIVEIAYTVRADTYREDPVNLFVEKSADATGYYTMFNAANMPPWVAGEKRVITKPDQVALPNAWRLFPAKAIGSSSWVGISELTFHSVSGGANVATGGWAFSDRTVAANAFDGNTATIWQNGVGSSSLTWASARIGYNKAAKYDLAEVTVRNMGTVNDSPISMHLERTLDWNTWTVDWSITTPATWTANETRTFTRPAATGAAEYWRLIPYGVSATQAGANVFGLATLELRETVGGPNVAIAANIASYVDGETNGSFPVANAFDGNGATIWAATGKTHPNTHLGVRFTSARSIQQIAIVARNDATYFAQAPTKFMLQRSTDGIVWRTVKAWEVADWTGAAQTRTFDV